MTRPTGRRDGMRSRGSVKRRRIPALVVIAGLLLASGLVRITGDLWRADASTTDADPADAAAACLAEDGAAELMAALAARDARLRTRETELATLERGLALAREKVDERIAALADAEASLAATLAIADTAADEDVARLVTVYENMKAKEAASLFAAMDVEFAAGFLGRMRPEVAAAILAGIEPTRAYAISASLAGRNAGAPGD